MFPEYVSEVRSHFASFSLHLTKNDEILVKTILQRKGVNWVFWRMVEAGSVQKLLHWMS